MFDFKEERRGCISGKILPEIVHPQNEQRNPVRSAVIVTSVAISLSGGMQ